MSHFCELGGQANLAPHVARGGGLREAQFGALAGLVAHSTVSGEPAQIVLPTGVGKTAVATLVPYVLQAGRALVVVPGKLIRSQIVAAFQDPSSAIAAGVLPVSTTPPTVAVADHWATDADWERWQSADVVIGTPAVLSPAYARVAALPRGLFDLVIFDEAHHLPASTWTSLLPGSEGRAVLLTATPFRNDGKRLPGEMIYTYPLSRAIDQGVYGEVRYIPVDAVDGEELDLTLAQAAADRIHQREHAEAKSRLIVRSDSVEHAKRLEEIYRSVGLPLGLIVHTTSWKRAQQMRLDVERGALQGFVCVGALTEGFDFPALKIGVYHVPHKTLGPTLQFIGRLSRVGEVQGELLAPRSAVTEETAALYREDVGWRRLLPDLVDSALDHERKVRAFVMGSRVSGPLDLPPLSLVPQRSVHILATAAPPNDVPLPSQIGGASVVQTILHKESQTMACITRRTHRPPFMRLDLLDVSIFDLHLVTWVERPGLLFISTTSDAALRDLRDAVAPGARRSLSSAELRRLLDAADFQRFFSIGTRAARAQSATSYQIRAGSKTEDDLTPADARGWELGHGIGRSGTGTFGFSVAKSKIWEPGSADSLYTFRAWCEELAEEIAHQRITRTSSKLDLFPISEPLERFPDHPLVATFSSQIYIAGAEIAVDGEIVVPERVEFEARPASSNPHEVTLAVSVDGTERASVQCLSDGTVNVGGAVYVRHPDESALIPLSDYLWQEPLTLFFAGGARVTGNRITEAPPTHVPVATTICHPRPWTDTAIKVEFGEAPDGLINVGAATADLLTSEMPVLMQDHLPGELADFIAIDHRTLMPAIRLVHCKASGSEQPAARVTDLEELVAQAIRSVQWLTPRSDLWAELRRRLDERSATKIVQGERDELVALLDGWSAQPPVASWSLWLVQPGVSVAALETAPQATSLINAAHSWVASQSVEFALICST